MKIYIDGTEVSSPIDGVSSISIRYRIKDEQGGISKSYSQELTFYGAGYEVIRAAFIDDPLGKFNELSFELIEDCCGEPFSVFQGVLRGDSIDWCEGECFVKVTAFERTPDTIKRECIQSTLIYDDRNGFQSQQHPRMVYCLEWRPSALQDVVMVLGIIVNLIFIILIPVALVIALVVEILNVIIGVINGIIDAINTVPGISIDNINSIDIDGDPDTNTIETFTNMIDRINENIIGCGRKHPSPLVRSYINNVCDICDITFESSILNSQASQYYNTVLYNNPVEKGTRDDNVKYITKNKPILTLEGFLAQLKTVFNGDYRITNGVLRFERKDFFYIGEIWIDYELLKAQNRIIEKVCYSWRDEEAYALGRFSYTEDPVDWCGNEARERYNDIVEWNQPFTPLQKGIYENILPFAPCRFRDDGIDRDVLADYDWFPIFGGVINDHNKVIIQNNGTNFQGKLLIWDGNMNFGRVERYVAPGFEVGTNENFNFPYLFNEFNVAPITAYDTDAPYMGLYGRFHSIDHPKLLADQGKEFEFTFKIQCEDILSFDITKNIMLPIGEGRIDWAEIDYVKRECTVFGKV